mmetsp:Transcript_6835/g.20597  ORF Transcript_6835/g.20597 Transcript_6835/m.20597 type:complete len:206 (-) Transcript_6835:1609-2226(-)
MSPWRASSARPSLTRTATWTSWASCGCATSAIAGTTSQRTTVTSRRTTYRRSSSPTTTRSSTRCLRPRSLQWCFSCWTRASRRRTCRACATRCSRCSAPCPRQRLWGSSRTAPWSTFMSWASRTFRSSMSFAATASTAALRWPGCWAPACRASSAARHRSSTLPRASWYHTPSASSRSRRRWTSCQSTASSAPRATARAAPPVPR